MDGNPSGSFLFVLMIAHGAHAIGGLATLFVTGINAFTRPFKVTPLRTLRFSLVLTFWHFVDILWVYLVLFVLTQ